LTTTTAFTASQTGLAVTLSGGSGSSATATVNTDGAGDITAVDITGKGTSYVIGDIVTVTEVGGTPGVGSFRVATIS
jgi:hypothetical protein